MTDEAGLRIGCTAIEQRVARGVALLDEAVPGWDARIDLNYLDVRDYHDCVLGQTFESSNLAVELLGIGDDAAAYGFEPAPGEDDAIWSQLDIAWRALILGRRPVSRPTTDKRTG